MRKIFANTINQKLKDYFWSKFLVTLISFALHSHQNMRGINFAGKKEHIGIYKVKPNKNR